MVAFLLGPKITRVIVMKQLMFLLRNVISLVSKMNKKKHFDFFFIYDNKIPWKSHSMNE